MMSLNQIPKREIFRKSIHVLGLFWIPFAAADKTWAILILIIAMLLYTATHFLGLQGLRLPLISTLIEKAGRKNNPRDFDAGPLTLASGITLSLLFFPLSIAAIGITQVALADALAGTLGYCGKHPLPYSKTKTFEGSFVFFVSALAMALIWLSWKEAVILALAGTILETLPLPHIDNLTVPLGVNLLAFVIF